MQTPSLDRIVHYVAHGSLGGTYPRTCRAAIVAEVYPDNEIMAFVINPTGTHHNRCKYTKAVLSQIYGEEVKVDLTPGTWHWPAECAT